VGGPKFRDGNLYPSDTSFPVLTSTLEYGPRGLSAAATAQGATATVTADTNYAVVHLVIPAANVDATLGFDGFATQNIPYSLNYVVLGEWLNAASPQGPETASWYAFGYETQPTSMPTTGQATFSGYAQGEVYAPVGGHILSTASVSPFVLLDGTARFSADFASGKITGAFTGMTYGDFKQVCDRSSCTTTLGPTIPWNDVSVTASIAAGTSRFSGTTAVTSVPQNTFSLSASATGHIDGGFYGPAAENLGAIWTLSDGTKSAIGGVAAGR